MTSRYFPIIEYTVELTISVYYKLESMCVHISRFLHMNFRTFVTEKMQVSEEKNNHC